MMVVAMNAKSLETTFHFLFIFLQINIIFFVIKRMLRLVFLKFSFFH